MKQWAGVVGLLATVALAGGAASETRASGEDDLAVVKKAVTSPAPAVRTRTAAAAAPTAPAVRSGREPQWFKVRVVDRTTGHKKVTINLPLSLVRALGDETIDWGCHRDRDRRDGDRDHLAGDHDRDRCHTVRIADVLRSLEAGQDLVEVEDDDATVKVWVE
jgi:hypothetical protein